jgi:transposase-like protein
VARKVYTDEQKAAAYVALQVNNNHVRRASKDSGVPESTIRDWNKVWAVDGPEPGLLDVAERIVGDFIDEAVEVRDLALQSLKRSIQTGELRDDKLITVVGVLEDKIRLGKGLATSRTETIQKPLDPEEVRDLLLEAAKETLQATKERKREMLQAGVEEIIPKGTSPLKT